MERRTALKIIGLGLPCLLLLPHCGRQDRQFDAATVLAELRATPAIDRLRNGEISFRYREIFSPRGKDALALIQRGLISLELLPRIEPSEYGVYGDKTAQAVARLQGWAGIKTDGRKIDQGAFLSLEKALRIKNADAWTPPPDY
jgi:hypothetical protein